MENDLNNKVVIRDELIQQIEELAPWHYDIRLTNDLSTGQVFSKTCRLEDQPPGLTIQKESTEHVMSGVYELAWVPNNPKTLKEILN